MRNVVIVSGCRTAIGSFGGAFKDVSAVDHCSNEGSYSQGIL